MVWKVFKDVSANGDIYIIQKSVSYLELIVSKKTFVVGAAAVADSAAVVVVEISTAIGADVGADVGIDGVAFVYLLRKLFYLLPKICFNESLITERCIFAFH